MPTTLEDWSDLGTARPRELVYNPDGTVSTVKSIGVGDERGEWVIPTIQDGRVLSNDEAIKRWKQGELIPLGGPFKSVQEGEQFAENFHQQEQDRILEDEDWSDLGAAPVSKPAEPLTITPPPWEQAQIKRMASGAGRLPTGMETTTEFIESISEPPRWMETAAEKAGLPKGLARAPMFAYSMATLPIHWGFGAAAVPGKVAYLGAADIVSKIAGQPEYGGNIAQLLRPTGQEFRATQFIRDLSKYSPKLATAAHVASAAPEFLSMAAVNPSGALGRLLAAGFATDTAINLWPMLKEFSHEYHLPEEQQDKAKLAELGAGIIESIGIVAIAGKHGFTRPIERAIYGKGRVLGRELSEQLKQAPLIRPPPTRTALVMPSPRGAPVPTAAETSRLMDRALYEAQRGIIVPGEVPAIELLRRQFESGVVYSELGGAPKTLEGGGPSPYGRVSFMRGAEAPTLPERAGVMAAETRAIERGMAAEPRIIEAPTATDTPAAETPAATTTRPPTSKPVPIERRPFHDNVSRIIEEELGPDHGYRVIFDPDLRDKDGTLIGGLYENGRVYINSAAYSDVRKLRQTIREERAHQLINTPEGLMLLSDFMKKYPPTKKFLEQLKREGYRNLDDLEMVADEFIAKQARENTPIWKELVDRVWQWFVDRGARYMTREMAARAILRKLKTADKVEATQRPARMALEAETERRPIEPIIADFMAAYRDPARGVKNTSDDPRVMTTVKAGMAVRSIADLDAMLELHLERGRRVAELQAKRDNKTITPAEFAEWSVKSTTRQFPREVIETATKTGSWVTGLDSAGKELGPRPLEWDKHPEVADWLIAHAKELNLQLPDALEARAGVVRYSLAPEYQKELEAAVKAGDPASKQYTRALDIQDRIERNKLFWRLNPEKTWLDNNADYWKSADPDSICQKSEGTDAAVNFLKTTLGDLYDKDMAWEVIARAQEQGLKTPCPQCYVFSARAKTGTVMMKKYVVGVGGYNGELARFKDANLEQIARAGLRHYSSTDFKAEHIPGLIVSFVDAQRQGIPMQAYSKQGDLARIFAPAGMYINLSIGRNDIVGMNLREALELREQHPTVGTVYVAFSDAEVLDALRKPYVDHVIPWHGSGQAMAELRTKLNDPNVKDYTSYYWNGVRGWYQRDTINGKIAEHQIKDSEHHGDLKTYLRLLRDEGATMRFPDIFNMLRQSGELDLYMKLIGLEYGKYGEKYPYRAPVSENIDYGAIERAMRTRLKTLLTTPKEFIDIAKGIAREVRRGTFERSTKPADVVEGPMRQEKAPSKRRFSLEKEEEAAQLEALEDYVDRVDRNAAGVLNDFLAGAKSVAWKRIPAETLRKIWLEYGKRGTVSDLDGLKRIKERILENIARLKAVTQLVGHTEMKPEDAAEMAGVELTEKQWKEFDVSDYITDQFSDYAFHQLDPLYEKIYRAKTPDELVPLIDRVLNVVHRRGDLAAHFIEGGSRTLDRIASQGGYEAPPEAPTPRRFALVSEREAKRMEKNVKLSEDVSKLKGQLDLFDSEIGEALTTGGQFLPKEIRPLVAKGAPAQKGTATNRAINQYFVDKLVTIRRNMQRLRNTMDVTADPAAAEYFKVLQQRFELAFRQIQELRRASHEALYFWNKIRGEYQEIARMAGEMPDIKYRKPILDQIVKDLRDRQFMAAGKDFVDYLRVNLFTPFSFTLDFTTNLMATAAHIPAWLAMDIAALMTGKPVTRTFSALRALQLSAGNLIPFTKRFRLTPEIERQLGTTAGGEFAGLPREVMVDFSEILRNMPRAAAKLKNLDYILGGPVRLKRSVDNFFGRFGAAADLYNSAYREGMRLGHRGDDLKAFVEDFVENPPEPAIESAVRMGGELKFNRPLPIWAERFANNVITKLAVEAYPRWTLQFTKWAGEMIGMDPSFFRRVAKGEANAEDIAAYLAKAATGWGALYAFNQLFYEQVDPNTMEYVNEKGERTRLSGRQPFPELYTLCALFRGDIENAKAGFVHTSIPFAGMTGGQGGLLSPIMQAMIESWRGNYTAEQTAREMTKILNNAIPGKSMLGLIRALHDPTLREGFGAPIPGVAQALPQRINVTTGLPAAPKQRIPGTGIELPTVGGTPFPGATRVMNPIERTLLNHGISMARPRRTSLIEIPVEEIPKELRHEYEQHVGWNIHSIIGNVIQSPEWGQLAGAENFEIRRELLMGWMTLARSMAKAELAEKYQRGIRGEKPTPMALKRLPQFVRELPPIPKE